MKKHFFTCLLAFFAFLVALVGCCEQKTASQAMRKPVCIRGQGYVRGRSMVTMKNKYAGYVSKVYHYSQEIVQKGDVILEYDDLPWRTAMEAKNNSILELELDLRKAELQLELVKLNPLSSEFRYLSSSLAVAEARRILHQKEAERYEFLSAKRNIPEFTLWEKQQELRESQATVANRKKDQQLLNDGLEKLTIAVAQAEVARLQQKLQDAKRELELLNEEGKYYRIVAARDGVVITNSDTVDGYNAAGTAAAAVHNITKGKLIYAYVNLDDVPWLHEGMEGRFRSNQFSCEEKGFPVVKIFKIERNRTIYGDTSTILVKCTVENEGETPLRIDSNGFVEFFP